MKAITSEPFRFFFPIGTLFFLWGILIWLPLIWTGDEYPVDLHRYLVLNGFAGSFIAGFLMTAVPRFSKTSHASFTEVLSFLLVTLGGLLSVGVAYFTALQALIFLAFLLRRIAKRKENPPYSFAFIFVGLLLWMLSGFIDVTLHEGAIAAIIFGVGSRLIPGVLGHVDIVSHQRAVYERPVSLLKTIPLIFILLMGLFVGSFFLEEFLAPYIRAFVVVVIAFKYWRLHRLPKIKSALTYSVWTSAWLITLSFVLRALWFEGGIHAGHSFFINGIALLSFLIATRVLVSHGPKKSELEDSKMLYLFTGLVILAASTRVSAYLMPEHYIRHLGYSSFILALAVLSWSAYYLKLVRIFPRT